MTYYGCEYVDNIISKYIQKGGMAKQLSEGVLGCGDWLLYDNIGKLKFIVIKEIAINEWSSAHTIRKFCKVPNKYKAIINN